jgi:REP element-mobilizing transposase RayT
MQHSQRPDYWMFVTFCRLVRTPFPDEARDQILSHCLHDNGLRYDLHAAVVMPDHVHLLLTPLRDEQGWSYALPGILKLIKGVSARSVNKLLRTSGPVWQEESFDHVLHNYESLQEKTEYIRRNPARKRLVERPEEYRWFWPKRGNL